MDHYPEKSKGYETSVMATLLGTSAPFVKYSDDSEYSSEVACSAQQAGRQRP